MKSLKPAGIAPPFARYSHGVEVTGAMRWVRTSGQLGLATDGTVPEGAEAQAAICFGNIDAILAEAGLDRRHVVHVRAYVTDRLHMAGYMAARDAWLAELEVLPTSTLLIVSGFTRPDFVVEIEVVAAA
jgi:enamine deaminase RidA (YjgF/YER057c/UK114 family)